MIDLDTGEQKLFAKYWGMVELEKNEAFWDDVYEYYSKEPRDAPLPIRYTPLTVRRVLDMLECPQGGCDNCCKTYGVVSVSPYDRERIVKYTAYSYEDLTALLTVDEKGVYINSKKDGACPFLGDKGCTIYSARPDTCYIFPLGFKKASINGEIVQQMQIRIRCPQALAVARELITAAVTEGKEKMLLPDLTIIPKYKG